MAIYLNVITLLLEFSAIFVLSILIIRKNKKSLTSIHLFVTFLIYSLSLIFNILFVISSAEIEIYELMFRMIVVSINSSAILLCGGLALVVWGEAEYKKKILLPSIILLVFIIILLGCYKAGVYYDPGSGLHFIVMTPLYGWSSLLIAVMSCGMSIFVLQFILIKLEKKNQKKLLFFSISLFLLLLDVIFLGLVNMRFIPPEFVVISHILMILSTIFFYCWHFLTIKRE